MKELGKAIKLSRVRKDMEPKQVAAIAKIHPKYYYRIERGDNDPSIRIIARIAAALEIPAWEIIKLAEELEKEGE